MAELASNSLPVSDLIAGFRYSDPVSVSNIEIGPDMLKCLRMAQANRAAVKLLPLLAKPRNPALT